MPEEIGSVNVSIGGDYSQLQADFEETVKAAQDAGKEVAEAFTSAADGEQVLEAAFQRLVDAGYTVNEAMGVFQQGLEQLQSAEAATASSTDAAGEAAKGAAENFADFGSAADRAAKDAMLFGDSAQEIVNSQREAEAELGRAQTALEEIRTAYSLGEASANDLARAESAVKTAFDDANPAMVEARDAAEKTKEETASLAEKFVALGEALAVTEVLKEFGQQAIEVASEQEKLVISLTALSGSAETAHQQLEEIDRFSFSNALEIDTVEAATQKMTAFGFSTEETSKLLQAAADSAAATGKSFDSTAEKIGNMALSGSAGARQLTTLGISLDDLGKQLGVTGDKASKAFKDLDQSERVVAITGALEKFQGTAAAVADSTSGRFQNLKNDVHNIFETLGGELLPIVNQMVGVLRDDVLPAIKAVTEWFGQLPAPVKTLAIDAGVLTAGLVPLAAGIAGVSLAIDGLKAVLPITMGLLESFGITSLKTAAEEDIAAASTLALGNATVTAGEEIAAAEIAGTSLAAILGTTLVAGAAAAVISLIDLKERLGAAHSSLKGLADADFAGWLKTSAEGLKTATVTAEDLEKRIANLRNLFDVGGISLGQYNTYLAALEGKLKDVKNEDLSGVLGGMAGKIHIVTEETGKAHDEISILRDVLEQAKAKVESLNAGYESGKVTAEQYEKAQNAVKSAQDKLNAATADAEAKAKLATVAYNEWREATDKSQKAITPYLDSVQQLAGAHDVLISKQEIATSKLNLLRIEFQEAQEKVFVLANNVKDAARALDGTSQATEAWEHAMANAGKAADDLKKKTTDLINAEIEAAKQVTHISGAIEDLRTSQDVAKDSQTAWANETKVLTEQLYEAQQRLVQLNKFVEAAAVADDGSTAAHERWIKAVEAAQKASDDLASKQESLAKAHTKAKLATDDLETSSIGFGVTLTQTVVPASEALHDQTEVTTTAIEAATVAADACAPAIESIGTAARASASAVGSLASDLKQLTQDFLGLGDAKSKSVSLGSAPDGYYWQASGNAFTGFKVNLAQIPEGMEIGPMGTPIAIPGYWEKKQAETAASASSSGSYSGQSSNVSSGVSTPTNNDTAAAGGTYPGVVIHQAAGEVLLVALAQASSTGGASITDVNGVGAATLGAASAAEAASITAMTVGVAANTMYNVIGDLKGLTDVIAGTVNQTQQIASRLGMIAITNPNANYTGNSVAGTVVGNSSTNSSVSQGMGNTIGNTITVGNSPYPTAGPPSYWASLGVTPSNAANYTPPVAVTVDMSNSTYGAGMESSDVAEQVKGAVTDALTRVLRDQGARY